MRWNNRKESGQEPRRLTLSDWDGAPNEEVTPDTHSHSSGGEAEGQFVQAPQMNFEAVYAALDNQSANRAQGDGVDATDASSMLSVRNLRQSSAVAPRTAHRSTSMDMTSRSTSMDMTSRSASMAHGPMASETSAPIKQLYPRQGSFFGSGRLSKPLHRRPSTASSGFRTATISSSASRTSYNSSAGSNIWTKMLGGSSEGLWDSANKDAYAYAEEDFGDDDSLMLEDEPTTRAECRRSCRRCGMAWWYETRHFLNTIRKHPHILVLSLLAFAAIVGAGMAAVNAEKNHYLQKQQGTAAFVARETATWFANEFRRAMQPLYSIQQGVIHSGYFDELPRKIGNFPNLVIPETQETPFLKRDVAGICDQPDIQAKWRDIVEPVNADNDLDGVVVGYRLFPANVACLTEPHRQESTKHFNASDFPQGDALLASDNTDGLDAGHAAFPLWNMITTDLFINRQFNVFGPFAMPPMNELICGHLAIWNPPGPDGLADTTLNVHGTNVANAWGFVVNFLDWAKLKGRSDIYKRFADCNLEFRLTRVSGPTAEGIDKALLAESSNADQLDDSNSIVIQTESLHGIWENRVGTTAGWTPPWYPGAVAAVVVGAFILGLLTASTLVERQLHRNLLYKIMPRRAIAKLQRGQTVLEKFNLVTIFFSDIVGFTSMSGEMRPVQVMAMLNELYTELDKLVEKHSVYKVETIGDAYMVVGGAPDRCPAPEAAERVARFALDALDFVKNFRTKAGDQIFIRAGLASGPTVAGVVGQAMPRYCFFGDTVNFASRMESTSKKMKIQCAEITFRLLQDAPFSSFELEKRTEGGNVGIAVKGKGHQITYWIKGSRKREHKLKDIAFLPPDIESPRPTLSKLSEAEEYSTAEIYAAVTSQDWSDLGKPSSSDKGTTLERAVAILEHHLKQVLKSRSETNCLSLASKVQLQVFVNAVAATYGDANFHNLEHAIHVLTSMNKLIDVASQSNDITPMNGFALVFSALLHDAGHTGMSNKILSDIEHPLSKKFEEGVPIAERYSIDLALDILFQSQYNELRDAILPGEVEKLQFAKSLFQSILVTDIAEPKRVQLGIKRYEISEGPEQQEYDAGLCPLAPHLPSVLHGVGLEDGVAEEFGDELVITHSGLKQCVRNEHLMQIADVAHLMQSWENFIKWNFRLYKELNECFKKGLCPDPKEAWYNGQVGFLDHYILPLAKRSHIYFNKDFSEEIVNLALLNLKLWMEHGVVATSIMVESVESKEKEQDALRRLYRLNDASPKSRRDSFFDEGFEKF